MTDPRRTHIIDKLAAWVRVRHIISPDSLDHESDQNKYFLGVVTSREPRNINNRAAIVNYHSTDIQYWFKLLCFILDLSQNYTLLRASYGLTVTLPSSSVIRVSISGYVPRSPCYADNISFIDATRYGRNSLSTIIELGWAFQTETVHHVNFRIAMMAQNGHTRDLGVFDC